jgi:hypothetical protein
MDSLDALLDEQYGAISRRQWRGLGLSDDAFDRRLRSGALGRRHAGVAVAQPWRHHPLAPLAAAVLSAGRGAQLALWTAGGLLGVDLRGSSDRIHLWVPHDDRRPSPRSGLDVRRSTHLSGWLDVTVRRRLPVTTIERSVVDRCALPLRPRDRESLVAEVLQRQLGTEARLAECAARNLRGARAVRAVLGLVSRHDSGLELELSRLGARAGLACEPLVVVVHPDGRRDEVDLLAVDRGLVLEADGWAYHRDPAAREADELRDERLRALGLVVLRFTARQVREQPEASLRRIVAAAANRSWAPPPGVRLELSARSAA